jgi:hypothetical protein
MNLCVFVYITIYNYERQHTAFFSIYNVRIYNLLEKFAAYLKPCGRTPLDEHWRSGELLVPPSVPGPCSLLPNSPRTLLSTSFPIYHSQSRKHPTVTSGAERELLEGDKFDVKIWLSYHNISILDVGKVEPQVQF